MNNEEAQNNKSLDKIEWLAPEYEHREQTVDWFWALAIIIVAGSIASIIYENYFLAVLIVIGGILLWYFSITKPEMVGYELDEEGLRIKHRMHPYEEIKYFWVDKKRGPTLHIQTKRPFLPTISMSVYPNITEKVRNKMLSKGVLEQEIQEHTSVKIMEYLGF